MLFVGEQDLKWYAIHVLSGHENKVKAYLENEIKHSGLDEKIDKILVPSEKVTEMRDGKKRVRNKIMFPGYMILHMMVDKETRHLIQNAPGVTSFVGKKNEPVPLQPDEAERIIGKSEGIDKDREQAPFHVGDPIKVVDGPFTDFTGFIEEINVEKSKVKVMVSIFGRSTPVELDFLQIELEQ
ncbi:transcription termination/antitermination factor NusG [candidate division KSB1 bacterium]|nr:transcription termination/antitermination factor NusG [candidate division KSB1 bacterium]